MTSVGGSTGCSPTWHASRRNLPRMAVAAEGAIRVVNPATLDVVGTVPVADAATVQEAVVESRLAQERFAETSFEERRRLLAGLAERVLERADQIADTRSEEHTSELQSHSFIS